MEAASVVLKCTASSSMTLRHTAPSITSSGGLRSALTVGCNGTLHSQLRVKKSFSVKRCTVMRWGGQDKDSGEERPETLFMRELAKRKKLGQDVGTKDTDTKTKEQETETPKFTDERDKEDQRKRSMALNSEGLDGLLPRGQELVKLGGTFWLSFWPFIAASVVFFLASYLYFGPAFLHSGTRMSPPPYVDPYLLLDSEELPPQVGPNRVPYNTDRSPQSSGEF
ncbi:hypothetical protein KC19_7G174500 [Ceratodon purpureus]|uniref:Transmembrane protein n=1 Tax=Ceratodon purpureus TaxID=3225 RepID=A0A8T0HG28_CERPU|nr:hypothetical protein KC19_7G174500 [Ceratodon purpureus]